MLIPAIKTWYDQRVGVVAVDDDVLGIIRRIKEIDSRLFVYYNEQTGGFDIVENCLDGTERLVFSVPQLDARVVDRLLRADHWEGRSDPSHVRPDDKDFLTEMDEDNEEYWRQREAPLRERLGDAGERLAWALDLPLKGNAGFKESIFVPGERSPFGKNDKGPDPD